jgi:hypothetical protein
MDVEIYEVLAGALKGGFSKLIDDFSSTHSPRTVRTASDSMALVY